MIIIYFGILIISLVLLFWQISNIISVIFGSPYVMLDKRIAREVFKKIGLKKGDIFYDLGCGNGDILIESSKFGARAVGHEISPYYYLLSKVRIYFWQIYYNLRSSVKSSIITRFIDIRKVDLSNADIIYVYLLPEFLEKLSSKFKKEMKKESTLISVGFRVNNLRLKEEVSIKDHKIFIYNF